MAGNFYLVDHTRADRRTPTDNCSFGNDIVLQRYRYAFVLWFIGKQKTEPKNLIQNFSKKRSFETLCLQYADFDKKRS